MLTIRIDNEALQRNLRQLGGRDAKQAAVWALNDTAADVLKHVHDRMDQVFDRPTRCTKSAFMLWRAKPATLEAEVMERPSVGRRHYLKAQELGGERGQTGLERRMASRLSATGQMQAAVPASGARLDAYGNWASAERKQAVDVVTSAAPAPTAAPTGRRQRKRAGLFISKPGSNLSPGIWKRAPDGTISKVMHFTSVAPVYSERLGFEEGAAEVYAARLPDHLARTFERMVRRVAERA